jgi:polyvinyl alcohol dehydrogenase (cytochrome)
VEVDLGDALVAMRRAGCALALAVAVCAGSAAGASAQGPASCDARAVVGGEWRSYGADRANTRLQPREKVVSAGDAPLLSPAWTFSTAAAGGAGDITGTPVIAGQCLYTATTEGSVFAVNADTGKLVWKAKLPYGGGINGTPTVAYGRVYVAATRLQKAEGCPAGDPCVGPYVVAFSQKTGAVKFASPSLDNQPGADVYGSPVVYPDSATNDKKRLKRAVMLIGISGGSAELGDEADRYAFQGSMLFLDPRDGKVLVKRWTIHPPKQPDDEFAGAGIWSTPAIDAAGKVAFAGTANPFKPQAEHKYANSVLKYGINRRDPKTFGQILGSYKGLVDEYIPGFSSFPCYDVPGNPPPYYPQGIGSCGDVDLDFGAAPNLFRDERGRLLVGAGQKSGVYHVFDAATMKPQWTTLVGPPSSLGGIVGSTAFDGKSIYGPVTVPGYLWSIKSAGGALRWIGPVADGVHWGNPVAVANGVAYTVDLTGSLNAFDTRNGALLAKRPLTVGGSGAASASWAGVSVARHAVYAAVGIRGLPEGFIVALRPGGAQDLVDDLGNTPGGGGGGGSPGAPGAPAAGSDIIAGPGAYASSYATPAVTTGVGGPVTFRNYDIAQHDVVAVDKAPDGSPLFKTKLIANGQTAPVEGLDRVQSGKSYGFFCSIHPGMRGTLAVR